MPSLCVPDGNDVESLYIFVESMITSWGNFDCVIAIHEYTDYKGCSYMLFVVVQAVCGFLFPVHYVLCVLFVFVCLLCNWPWFFSCRVIVFTYTLHVKEMKLNPDVCFNSFFPSGSSATLFHLIFFSDCSMHAHIMWNFFIQLTMFFPVTLLVQNDFKIYEHSKK